MCYSLREICIETGLKKGIIPISYSVVQNIVSDYSDHYYWVVALWISDLVFKKFCNRIILKFLFQDYFLFVCKSNF